MKNTQTVADFLACTTPVAWVEAAQASQALLLLDHANCEKKAAATAFKLMFQYGERDAVLQEALSRLAREELRHFEQVTRLMKRRGIAQRPLGAARYAEGLRRHVRKREPQRLVDLLIVGAFIEARSCERFHAVAGVLDAELAAFYRGLEAAESRHFSLYLTLAGQRDERGTAARVAEFAAIEAELINSPDEHFRFHSGVPVTERVLRQ